jgi:SOS response regulatory protein OraA/RecX
MSSIGGINSSGLDIMQILQRLTRQRTEEENTTGFSGEESSGSQRAGFESRLSQTLKAMGVSDDEVATILDEIKSSISEAMKQSDGTTDPRQIVQSMIEQTLQEHGIDTDEVKSQMKPPTGGMPSMGGMPPGNGMPPGMEEALKEMGVDDDEISTIQEEIQAALDELTNDTESTTDPREAARSVIDETLQKHGVDTEELKSLMKPPQDGSSIMAGVSGSLSNEGILAQLGYSANTDDSSYQLLLSLLPLMDEQA